ncbi:MAG: hypothetical protein CMP59_07365, partial [Flavobacteriales bacterium]|nr:hypothetical protein [Flavobacteriales bacterium]
SLKAQEPSKLSLELKWYLEAISPAEMVPLLVEANSNELSKIVEGYGGKLRLKVGLLYSIDIPATAVEAFSMERAVEKIEFSNAPAHFLNDTMLIQTRADQVQAMLAPLRQQYSGKGIVLGVIDSGIELDHPDFQDSLGNTRVLYVWDQGVLYDPAHQAANYTYGVEWDSTEINNNTSTHDDNPSEFGHGSMVTGAAASNALATGNFKGIAPEVNIISVATDFAKPNWLQTVAEAVDYIFSKADSLGMPCVINASIGTYIGSHDGEDIAARMIDQMIKAKSGRTLVAAAGNAGTFNFHLQHAPQQDTLFSWFEHSNQLFNGQGGLYFQVWADTADMDDIEFSIGTDRKQGSYYEFRARTAFDSIQNRLNVIYTDSIIGANQNRIAYVYTYAEQSRGRYLLEVAIPQPDSAQYLYRFESAGTGKLDIWSSMILTGTSNIVEQNLPSQAQFPDIQKYVKPDSLQSIVSSFTCLPSVITVGNYVNRSSWIDANNQNQTVNVTPGQISINSSLGPNRRGYLKPDISSAGDYMFSAGRLATMQALLQNEPEKIAFDSLHMRNGGTSMAAPTVAGMIALYLEQCSGADYQRIKQDLISAARTDQFTQNLPNPKWGNGKADAMAFLSRNVFQPQFAMLLPEYCVGDTATIAVSGNYQWYRWSNGDTTNQIAVNDTTLIYVEVQDSVCKSVSDSIQLSFRPLPSKPTLVQRTDSLIANVQGLYRWYFNGSLIGGQTDSILVATQSGDYFAEVINVFGCSSFSDTINYISTSIVESESTPYKIYPNPAFDKLFIRLEKGFDELRLINLEGKELYYMAAPGMEQPIELEMGQLNSGIYLIELIGNGEIRREKILKW